MNSIEEDIEIIESIIEEYENCSVPEVDMQVNVTFREKQNNALNHILSDYKRVLKENELLRQQNISYKNNIHELKEDRNNNYQMIALAQNEMLGYIKGYEDGKKSEKSAVAFAVENQQYYIIKKEIEHYKEHIVKLQKENEELNKNYNSLIDKIILKIDEYDYKFEKAKKQNKNDIADYYWDLIINFKKLLGGE